MGVTKTEFWACVLAGALFVAGSIAFVRLPERNGREPYRFKTVSAATLAAADVQLLPPKSPELAVSREEALQSFARFNGVPPREVILTDIRYSDSGPGGALDTYFAWVAVDDGPHPLLIGPLIEPGQPAPAQWQGDWLLVINAAHPDAGMTAFGIGTAGAAAH